MIMVDWTRLLISNERDQVVITSLSTLRHREFDNFWLNKTFKLQISVHLSHCAVRRQMGDPVETFATVQSSLHVHFTI